MLRSLYRQLLLSSRDGGVNEVVSLLEQGANTNCKDTGTSLHWAAQEGHVECVRYLLSIGVEVDKTDLGGSTPLQVAASNGHVECIKALLDSGAELNAQDNGGITSLHTAALDGHMECVKALLARGAEVDTQDKSGNSPLHYAALNGYVDCIKTLLANGAEVNSLDHSGSTPLHEAAWEGHVDCIKALIVNGAEVGTQDKDGNSPLYCAALNGHVESIKTLLGSGAMETIKNALGQTALDKALQEGQQESADAIRSHSWRRSDNAQQGGDQQPDQNSSGNLQTENEELKTQLATARSMIDDYAAQLAESRAKNDEFEVRMACKLGQQDVIASQDLGMFESLMAKGDLGCLMMVVPKKVVPKKPVQRELNKARDAATECGVCLSAPKDTCLHPCSHTMCRSCSELIQLCLICRQTIAERRRVFLLS
eukprot:gene19744-biopygen28568